MTYQLTDRQKGLLGACITALCWSFLVILLKIALKYSDSYTIVWYRMTVAFTLLSLWFLYKGNGKDLKVILSPPGWLLVGALCLGFNYVGFMQGVYYATPATAQIFIQVGPLLLAIAGIFIFKEKLSRSQIYGLTICILGFILFFADKMAYIEAKETFYLGILWVLSGSVAWAIYAGLLKKLLLSWKTSQVNVYVYLVISLLYLPMVDWQSLQALPWGMQVFYFLLGVMALFIYGCLSVALKYLPATEFSPIIAANPLVSLGLISLIDTMQWGFIPADPMGYTGYVGAFMAVVGIFYVLRK